MNGKRFERILVRSLSAMGCEVSTSGRMDHQEKTDCLITRVNKERLGVPIRIQFTFRLNNKEKLLEFVTACSKLDGIGFYVEAEHDCVPDQVAFAILQTLEHLRGASRVVSSYLLRVRSWGSGDRNEVYPTGRSLSQNPF